MHTMVLRDALAGSTAHLVPAMGFNCFRWSLPARGEVREVLDAPPDFLSGGVNSRKGGIPILFPFPNRVRNGRFVWEGVEYELLINDSFGNAIHGLVMDLPWRVVGQTERSAVGQFQLSIDAPERRFLWPADFLIEAAYELRGSILRCDFRIANVDRRPLPWGLGTHPYFKVPLDAGSTRRDCLVRASAAELWELIDCLPTGRRLPVTGAADLREGSVVEGLQLDHVLTNQALVNGHYESLLMDARAGLQVVQRSDPLFRELVVFTPPHGRSVCLEPYTCPTDAVHLAARGLDAGWRVLAPGEEIRLWIEIELQPVLA